MADDAKDIKAELLEYSYEQVLDATKHQDDKVGRLLTTIAFLTAASLALAGLGSAKVIAVPVNLGGDTGSGTIAIAFVCLLAFIVGVSITVIQLIGSLSTPLRLPGLDPARGSSKDSTPSTIYFHEIEKNTIDEWRETWSSDADTLRWNRTKSLVGETHNLALRTSFKYNRTNEAQAVLTWALIALSLTVSFVAIIIFDETQPLMQPDEAPRETVSLESTDMGLLGSVLAVVTFVWSVARMRHSRLGKEDDIPAKGTTLQLAVVFGCAISILWAAGLPLVLDGDQSDAFRAGVGFWALFTGTCMSWATWLQVRTRRTQTGVRRLLVTISPTVVWAAGGCALYQLWSDHNWRQGLPWAWGAAVGALVATVCAGVIGGVELAPDRNEDPLPDHSGEPIKCPHCREQTELAMAKRVKWRVWTILTFSAGLSFVAQTFHRNQAYVWPLIAACGALTALIGVAVLEPTFMERRERGQRKQRVLHRNVLGLPDPGSRVVDDGRNGGAPEQVSDVRGEPDGPGNADAQSLLSCLLDCFCERRQASRRREG